MEIEVRRSDGTTARFSGNREELELFTEFVQTRAPDLLAGLGLQGEATSKIANNKGALGVGGDDHAPGTARAIHEALEKINAATDIERVTVMAHYAVQNGDSLTYEMAQQWYAELGLPKPGNWRSTFNNAKTRGYLHSTTAGWRPTTAGENLSTHGIRKGPQRRRGGRGGDGE